MLSFLKDHPFAVEAFFERSFVVTYAAPKNEVAQLVPDRLEVDTFEDKWAFVAVAMVRTKGLRPKSFPAMFGSDFFLIGYRVFVQFTDANGKRSRGLYILGSATDKKRMEFFGNLFTHYNYATTDISETQCDGRVEISSEGSRFKIAYAEPTGDEIPLPDRSPFATWKEARRFAGPLPFTFTYEPGRNTLLVIEGVRQNWTPEPVKVIGAQFSFIDELNLSDARLANAFLVSKVPYYWKKGRRERVAE
jgi:hypothetical protein